MATKKSQRIFIWVIAVAMTVGTIGGFLAMILQPQNQKADRARIQQLTAQYQKDYTAYQSKVDAQAKQLSAQYYDQLAQLKGNLAAFDKDSVKELSIQDLKVGDGAEIKEDSNYAVYYIGWNPTGKMFDSSFEGEALKTPLIRDSKNTWTFPNGQQGGVIEGWEKGLLKAKVGGARLLTIPSNLAYKEAGQGEDIPANTPLKFVLMIIPAPEKIVAPTIPSELQQYYSAGAP